jgi:purine-binding chemotaxis protein CheW
LDHRRREILVFEVGGRRFGLHAADLREIVRAVTIVPVPLAPPTLEGVVNLRGTIVPVLDLRARLGLPPKTAEPDDHLVFARTSGRPVALRIDRPLDLLRLADTDTDTDQEAPPGGGGVPGVAKLADGLAAILDVEALWSREESDAVWGALGPGAASVGEGGRS